MEAIHSCFEVKHKKQIHNNQNLSLTVSPIDLLEF